MREEKRRRGNEAVWPYIRSRFIQTKKRKYPKQVIVQTVQAVDGSVVTPSRIPSSRGNHRGGFQTSVRVRME